MKRIASLALVLATSIPFAMPCNAFGQNQSRVVLDNLWKDPVYRVAVGERTTKAINYRHRSGPLPKSIFAAPI